MDENVTRPVVLYVQNINFNPKFPPIVDRVTVVDIEITEHMAKQIIEQLTERLKNEENHIGAIRIRFAGKMVLA